MNRAAVAKSETRSPSDSLIAAELKRLGVGMRISIEDCGVLIQTVVTSAEAARMLAPMKGKAAGQFRILEGNLVEIDAVMTHAMARRVLSVTSDEHAASPAQLH